MGQVCGLIPGTGTGKGRNFGGVQSIFNGIEIFELMGNWQNIKLKDVSKHIQSGGTPKSDNPEFYSGDIPFVSIEDLTASKKYLLKTIKALTTYGLKNSAAWLVSCQF